MSLNRPLISVVVASHDARASLEACLASLVTQRTRVPAEVLVVDALADATADLVGARFPDVTLVPCRSSALVPERWTVGITHSSGDVVAITNAHCVPAQDWLERIAAAHREPVAAVGGAIEPDGSAGLVEWAIYLCRYSRYMLPFPPDARPEPAGDNASYKRARLEECRDAWRHGFWEPTVHARLRRAGWRLVLDPSIVVHHGRSYALGAFLRQRFQHGRRFGAERAGRLSRPARAAHVGLAPLVPGLLLTRIVRNVLVRRRHRTALLRSLPALTLFLLAWTGGEVVGTVRGWHA